MTEQKKSGNKKSKLKQSDIQKIIIEMGPLLERMWQQQSLTDVDISNNSADLLKMIQLIEKYQALHEKNTPQVAEKTTINYALIRNYLNKKLGEVSPL